MCHFYQNYADVDDRLMISYQINLINYSTINNFISRNNFIIKMLQKQTFLKKFKLKNIIVNKSYFNK